MWPFKKEVDGTLLNAVKGILEDLQNVKMDLKLLQKDYARLEAAHDLLRGQFNRKLKGLADWEAKQSAQEAVKPEEKKEEHSESKNLKPFTGIFNFQ